MKKTTKKMVQATPCPYQSVKRPMSRGSMTLQRCYRNLLLLLVLILSSTHLVAQTTYTLRGTVTDSQGSPLPGATITETATKQAAQSDSKGRFSLSTPAPTGTITITYLGYQNRQITYDTDNELSIKLSEDPSTLKSVEINTGYYSVNQKNLTGSITSIKAEQIEKQPISNPILALQGRVTGAYIQQTSGTPGSSVNITIRGQNSITAGTAPLYLVDGVPFGQQSLSSSLSQSAAVFGPTGSSPFATLAPEDIESISILKDADATAIYGSRGANGVVLITTKKGKAGKTNVQFISSYDQGQMAQRIEMMDTRTFLDFRRTALALDGITAPRTTDYDLNGSFDQNRYTNWQDELLSGKADAKNLRLAVSGGNQSSTFHFSATHNSQGTIFEQDQRYKKTTVQLSSTHIGLDEKLRLSASFNYSTDKSDLANANLVNPSITLQPNAPALRNPDGSLNWAGSSWINPLRLLENKYLSENRNLISNASGSYEILKGLNATVNGGYTTSNLRDNSYIPVSYYDPAQNMTPANSTADYTDGSSSLLSIEPQLSYDRTSRLGNFNVLLGYSFQSQKREQVATRAVGFSTDEMIKNLRAATTVTIRDHSYSDYRYSGIYARAGYSYQNRYLVNLTARRDGSSRFGTGRKMANFGAIGLAYIASETAFFKEILPAISFFKLRASYGTSGNDQIGDYEYLNTYQFAGGYNNSSGLAPVRLYNPDFAWELNKKLELAADFSLWKERIRGSLAYYRNKSGNQLIDYPLPATTGFMSIRANLDATVINSGLELELSAVPFRTKLHWETGFNLTLPRNKLTRFDNLENSSYASTYVIGESLQISRAYELLGVDPQTGVYVYTDFNGDGQITASDRLAINRKGQSAYGGWNNSFTYKNFAIDFLFEFVVQRISSYKALSTNAPGGSSNQPMDYAGKFWTKPGDIAELQRPTAGTYNPALAAYNNYYVSTAVNADGSFARLKNLSISYTERKLIKNTVLKIFLQGQNLWTITNYFGLEPENSSLIAPLLRTYQLGFQLSL